MRTQSNRTVSRSPTPQHGGEQAVVQSEERRDHGDGAERPAHSRAAVDGVERRPGEERGRHVVAEVEERDVPVAACPDPLGDEGDRHEQDEERRRQHEDGREERRQREL
jgi:hypothetical protein